MKLEIKNLNKSYDFKVFENLNISFDSNLIHLTGENGSGKSTLLKILSGKIKYESGDIFLNGYKVDTNYLAENTVLIDQKINLFSNDRVIVNIKKIVRNKVDYSLIEKFGFTNELNKKVSELSGGFKKKLMIIIALMLKPSILLLDEYSSYIDLDSLKMINESILEYSKDHLVIYVDHNDSLNGIEKSICSNDLINVQASIMKKSKFSFDFRFNLFNFISVIFFLIFIISAQVSTTYSSIKSVDIIANYIDENDLWFQPCYLDTNVEYPYYYLYDLETSTPYKNVFYTNDDIPLLKESNNSEENECYVFYNLIDYYEKKIYIDDKEYYVKGIIDLNVEHLMGTSFEYYLNSFVIKGEYSGEGILQSKFINVKNDAKKLYKSGELMYFYELNNYNDFEDLYKIIIVFLFVFSSVSIVGMSLNMRKEVNILNSYKKSRKKIFLDEILSMFIVLIFVGVISYISSYYILLLIYNKIIPEYHVTFMRPYQVILICSIIYIISYILSLYIVAFKKRKSIESTD